MRNVKEMEWVMKIDIYNKIGRWEGARKRDIKRERERKIEIDR
jgi:hypothetical protein